MVAKFLNSLILNEWPYIFSIMGETDNTGIIPRFAEELFTRIDSATVEEVSRQHVCICLVLSIYNYCHIPRGAVLKLKSVSMRYIMKKFMTS